MYAILYENGGVGGVADGIDIYEEAERLGGAVVKVDELPPQDITESPVMEVGDPLEKLKYFLQQNPDVSDLLYPK